MRSVVVVVGALTACDAIGGTAIERVSLRSECGILEHDVVEATVDGRRLCGRAMLFATPERPDGSEAIIVPGSFSVVVTTTLEVGDTTSYFLAVGVGPQVRRVHKEPLVAAIGPVERRGPERREHYESDAAKATFAEQRPLDTLSYQQSQLAPTSGTVTFDHYDMRTGNTRGSFELQFSATTPTGVPRPIHVTGTFETATPPILD